MNDDSKTISEWLKEYRKIIESSNISEKTVDNRSNDTTYLIVPHTN